MRILYTMQYIPKHVHIMSCMFNCVYIMCCVCNCVHFVVGPNAYTLDSMLGKTTRAGKVQAPCYSMRGKSEQGAFYQDMARVRYG